MLTKHKQRRSHVKLKLGIKKYLLLILLPEYIFCFVRRQKEWQFSEPELSYGFAPSGPCGWVFAGRHRAIAFMMATGIGTILNFITPLGPDINLQAVWVVGEEPITIAPEPEPFPRTVASE